MKSQVVARVISRMLIPFVLVFGFYVITHGEIGPGGGFQGGVILASAVILHALVHGLEETRRALPQAWVDRLMVFGVLLYAGVGVAGFFTGHAFLDYSGLGSEPHGAEALGMQLVETGVGCTVAAVMVTLFAKFDGEGLRMSRLAEFNYWIYVVIMMIGFYAVIARHNLVKKVIGLGIFQTGIFLLYISMGVRDGGIAPIRDATNQDAIFTNPIPHVLILTAIVVSLSTMAVALAIIVEIQRTYGTIEADEILAADLAAERSPGDPDDTSESVLEEAMS